MPLSAKKQRSSLHSDLYLAPYREQLARRAALTRAFEKKLLASGVQSISEFANGHEYFGLHFRSGQWIFREWAPNATAIFLTGEFSNWQNMDQFKLSKLPDSDGVWQIVLAEDALCHGMHYRLNIHWPGGNGDRLPAYSRRVVQDCCTLIFNAQVWKPEKTYCWCSTSPPRPDEQLIYESHVGMACEEEKVGTYNEFAERILPRIAAGGYNTVQLMAVMEHPYYGSFGYHVSNFFALSSRFGTPEEFKALVDRSHELGLRVIIDLVHSHAVRNEVESLATFDGTPHQYFHAGERGLHRLWDSLCFDYGKVQVVHFLLSNCRFWLDEYKVDGFRFDGITSMLYLDHGLGRAFTCYEDYFNDSVDEQAITYLTLANKLIHQLRPDAVTIAEDVSGMPGLGAPLDEGGCGFDCRMAMGVTDYWFKLFDLKDEDWNMGGLWHELTSRRKDERTISYVESHDQALVGGQTVIFRLVEAAMYDSMSVGSGHPAVDRGVAIHKLARLATLGSCDGGYLNFMGNEFGHPEWIDFPREGNDWSYKYARRQWSLADNESLYYHFLGAFDRKMMQLAGHPDILNHPPQLLKISDGDKVLAFERGGLFFFFNFNCAQSFSDYAFEVPPGKYQLVLDTDSPEFGGHGRIEAGQCYFSHPVKHGTSSLQCVKLYLPSRTALVLKKSGKA